MNRLLGGACAVVFALLIAAPAHAGDFKGPYVGLTIGGVANTSNASTSTVFSPTGYFATTSVPAIAATGAQKLNPDGFTFGGQFGFNLQHHAFVVGVEADLGSMNVSAQKSATATYPCCAPTAFTVTQFVGTSWLFTLRPRVGFTAGPVLIYGTGGLAVTSVDYSSLFTDTFATAHEAVDKSSTQNGWVAGFGAEFKVKHHWSVKGEYLHTNFGSQSNTATDLTAFTPPIAFPTNVFTHTANLTGNIYRFGFNYRF
ncbi:MAG TPA: outer membrane beta-barrel protein [Candidatus Angelobacter sp.]